VGKIAAAVARAIHSAVSAQLNTVAQGNGGNRRVRRLQQEKATYRHEIAKAQQPKEKR